VQPRFARFDTTVVVDYVFDDKKDVSTTVNSLYNTLRRYVALQHDIFAIANTIYTRFARIRYDINSITSRKGHIVPRAYRIRKDISQIPLGIYIALVKKLFKNPHFAVVMIKNHLFMQNQAPFLSTVNGRKGATPLCSF